MAGRRSDPPPPPPPATASPQTSARRHFHSFDAQLLAGQIHLSALDTLRSGRPTSSYACATPPEPASVPFPFIPGDEFKPRPTFRPACVRYPALICLLNATEAIPLGTNSAVTGLPSELPGSGVTEPTISHLLLFPVASAGASLSSSSPPTGLDSR